MPIIIQETISQVGVAYFVQRARAIHVNEAQEILNDEVEDDPVFRECWHLSQNIYRDKARSNPHYQWNNMEVFSRWALICFLLENPNISRRVNHFCRQALPEPGSWDAFPFKGLWVFVLLGFEKLSPFQTLEVFRGVTAFSAMPNGQIPTLQFFSASCLFDEAKRFALPQGFVLTLSHVNPVYMSDVRIYSVDPHKEEVLIWPLATFGVVDRYGISIEASWLRGTTPDCEPRRPLRFF